MSDFAQNGIITTLHDFKTKKYKDLNKELKVFSGYRPIELILPCLYSELEGSALPNIVKNLSEVDFLNHVVIGLDKANKKEFLKAKGFFKKLNINHTILWNDGPGMKSLDKNLSELSLSPLVKGKGRNVWYCLGYVLSRNQAEVIALHDCDILTYDKNLLARLVYPIANPLFNFEFCKGFYPRVTESKINGRVTRLLINPLLSAFESTIGRRQYIDYMKSFRYPLSGEFSFRKNLLTDIRIPSDWGIEIGVLSEVYRSNNLARICQVDIADNYDHKHQDLSPNDPNKGLSKMAIDIIKTFIRKLAIEGSIFSQETFRTLKASYYRNALDAVEMYRCDSIINGLPFDVHKEEKIAELFAENIMYAGDKFIKNPMSKPFSPSWNRILSAYPNVLEKLRTIVANDSKI